MTYERLETGIVACQLELTNICPLTCAECAYRFQERPRGHMIPELAKSIINDCVDAFGPISFNLNGLGEPLYYRHIADIIRYIGTRSPKSRIELFTNLICKDDKRVRDVISALKNVQNPVLLASSFHLYDHNGVRFKRQFQYYHFADFHEALGDNSRIDFHVAMNITKYHTAEDSRSFLDTFSVALPADKIHIVEKLDPWLGLVSNNAVATSEVITPGVCDYPFKVLHFGWDGRQIICCTDDVSAEMQLGYYEAGSIDKLWNCDRMREIRERHNNLDVEEIIPCNRCGRTMGYFKR